LLAAGTVGRDEFDSFLTFSVELVGSGAGGRSGGVIPSTDMADGSFGTGGGLLGFWPNFAINPLRGLSLAA